MNNSRLQIVNNPVNNMVNELLVEHQEVLVVTADQVEDNEVDLKIFTKFKDNGVLTQYLEEVLVNLIRIKNGKKPHQGQATTST